MAEGVEGLPLDLEILAFRNVKVLLQRGIRIPETWRAARGAIGPLVAVLPPRTQAVVIEWRAIGVEAGGNFLDHCRIVAEVRLKRVRIPPLVFTLPQIATATTGRIPDQVRPATADPIAGSKDNHRDAALKVPILCKGPPSKNLAQRSMAEETPSRTGGQLVCDGKVKNLGDIIRSEADVPIEIVWILRSRAPGGVRRSS